MPQRGINDVFSLRPIAKGVYAMRKMIRWIIYGIIYIPVLPFGLLSVAWFKIFGSQAIFFCCAETFSLMPSYLGLMVRSCYYYQTLKKAHPDLVVLFGGYVSKMNSKFGRNVKIGGRSMVGLVDVGDNTAIGNNVNIISGRYQHNFVDTSKDVFDAKDHFESIKIGSNCFIGDNSVVMASVGNSSIIGAGSVVVSKIPDYVVAVGNPAKPVKERPGNGQS